ncbi:UNVERIFIED_CONTAM: hypothetical protein HDU68_009957 [Siphonaria sp. JEL0065]|nr:hypothetical protein HDU68_009957 [Siphonaria sp. JEL0065]
MSKYNKVVSDPAADYRVKTLEIFRHLYSQCNEVVQKSNEARVLLQEAVSELKSIDRDSDSVERVESIIKKCEGYEATMFYAASFFTHISSVTVGTNSPLAVASSSGNTVPPLMVTRKGLEDSKETFTYTINTFNSDQDVVSHNVSETNANESSVPRIVNVVGASAALARLAKKSRPPSVVERKSESESIAETTDDLSYISDDYDFDGFDGIDYESVDQRAVGTTNPFKPASTISVKNNVLAVSARPMNWRSKLLASKNSSTNTTVNDDGISPSDSVSSVGASSSTCAQPVAQSALSQLRKKRASIIPSSSTPSVANV